MAEIRDSTARGTGLLAIFCDLDADDHEDFRLWLVEDMFPARMQIDFDACTSYDRVAGEGQQYLIIYEVPSLGHLYGEAYQGLRQHRKPRDAPYHEKFRNPERYTLAWTGPELVETVRADERPAMIVRVDRLELGLAQTQDFNGRFVGAVLPALCAVLGIVSVRRYLAMEGTPRHFILCEADHERVFDYAAFTGFDGLGVERRSGLYGRVVAA